MPIMTKEPVSKGSPANFTLDKAELALLISDPYWNQISNWKSVTFYFKSSTSKQSATVSYDNVSSEDKFLVSANAKGDFQIQTITIHDFDNDSFVLSREYSPASGMVISNALKSELDVNLTVPPLSLIGEYFANVSTRNGNVTNRSVYSLSASYNLHSVAVNISLVSGASSSITGMKVEVMSQDGNTVLATSEVKNVTRTSATSANDESNWETFTLSSPVAISSPDVVLRYSASDNGGLAVLSDISGPSNRFFNPNTSARLFGTSV